MLMQFELLTSETGRYSDKCLNELLEEFQANYSSSFSLGIYREFNPLLINRVGTVTNMYLDGPRLMADTNLTELTIEYADLIYAGYYALAAALIIENDPRVSDQIINPIDSAKWSCTSLVPKDEKIR